MELEIKNEGVVLDFFGVIDLAAFGRTRFGSVLFNNDRIDQHISIGPVDGGYPGLSDLVLLVVIIFHVIGPYSS